MTPRRLLLALPWLAGLSAAAAVSARPLFAAACALLAAAIVTVLLDHLLRKDRP